MKKLLLLLFISSTVFSQEVGIVKGKIIDKATREPVPFVNIVVDGTNKGTTSLENGMFEIKNVPLGYMKLRASFVGFETVVSDDYLVTKSKIPFIIIEIKESLGELDEVIVRNSLFKRKVESPVSLQNLGIAEIERNPGGDRDVLKVIQSLPGVASNPGFRNDIIIRGGGPSENKFYVDGIEVPVINHFQTQGASGGPVGIMNADLIRKVDFYSSAFPANRGNALSSVIEFTQKTGNRTEFETRATLGTSDAGITVQGPLSKNTSVIFSTRRSYLQYLFKLIKLPFLPTYTDFQLNVKSKFSNNDELSVFGLGAIDNFKINKEVNKNITDEQVLKRNRYTLANIPVQTQWNYTVGASYKHFAQNSVQTYVLSRNEWQNDIIKYRNNTNQKEDLLFDYSSKEIENKFRFENNMNFDTGLKLNVGLGLKQSTYTNSTFRKFANFQGVQIYNFSSDFSMMHYALFGQLSYPLFNDKLTLSLGVRLDGNDYNTSMKNPLNQFSPRFSLSYMITNQWFLNSSFARYYQLPSYTVLGYRDNDNQLVNRSNLKYISSTHSVVGLEFRPTTNSKITLEGFYKKYAKYPFSLNNQISLANLGNGFGVVGNEPIISNNKGRSYGLELLVQKKSYDGLYGILSYTFVRSEFQNAVKEYIPSTWDNRHLLTFTGGTKLPKNWSVGSKFRVVGGRPYTPYDIEKTSLIANYNVNKRGVLDYSKLNSKRFDTYTQLDFRVDKTWYYNKWSFNFYVDIQNVLASSAQRQDYLIPITDENSNPMVDPDNPSRYLLEKVESTSGRALPRIGFVVDF